MTKEDILDYVVNTPTNTNKNVLTHMLDTYAEEGSATEPYMEEIHDKDDNLIKATLHGYNGIRAGMFYESEYLEEVDGIEGIQYIDYEAFEYCAALTDFEIPETVEWIGSYAFSYSGLESIVIPEGITILDSSTFSNCEKLTEVSLPSTLITLENNVFENSGLLGEFIIPANTLTIGYSVLASTGITKITFEGTPQEINEYAFIDLNGVDIYVPWYPGEFPGDQWAWGAENATIYFNGTPTKMFTIEDTKYFYEEGQSWEEWVESSFNTDGYIIKNNKIIDATQQYEIHSRQDVITPSDIIINDYAYILDSYVELISFNIVDIDTDTSKTYDAESGMNFAQWVDSQYNIDGYYINDNKIYNPTGSEYLQNIFPTREIQNQATYVLTPNPY